jgi:tetratricopeptide (TPR) repeat protein
MKSSFRKTLLFLALASGLSSSLWAYTAADYYNAGLQLYQAKNYSQAIPYFSAAIQMDPNNTQALHGRANCNYLLGQYAPALTDYQQIQALQPTDQMAQFIQGLQARVSAASAPANVAPMNTTPANVAPTENPMNQGMALYQSRQYRPAATYFQQAIQQNPNDYLPCYWMGAACYKMGDNRGAVVYFTLTDRLKPNPTVKAYAQKLFARLSDSDQLWVNDQLAQPSPGSSAPAETAKFGVRLEPFIVLLNWSDFNAQGAAGKSFFGGLLNDDPNLNYTAQVPAGYANLGIEPVYQIDPDLEIGLALAYGPIGSFTEALSSAVFGNSTTSQNFTAFSLGLNARYFLTPGSLRFFVAGGPLAAVLSDSLTNNNVGSTYTASLSSSGFGGQVQLGLDWHLDSNTLLTPVLGYQVVGMSALSGTSSLGSGLVTEMFNANPNAGYSLLYITSTPASMPSGWRPVSVDLSGPFAGLTLSKYF